MLKEYGVLTVKAFGPYDTRDIDIKNKAHYIHVDLIKYFDMVDIDIYKPINKVD
jgi:hypothetical protein